MIMPANMSQELKFPVEWYYHIITEAGNVQCEAELKQLLAAFDKSVVMTAGQKSGVGKYQSYRARVKFENREDMETLSRKLGQVKGVKFLL